MKSEAGREYAIYEPSGNEIRIHWNITKKYREDMDGTFRDYWETDEALCLIDDDRDTLIAKIKAENADQATAEALADGWINVRG